MSTEATDEKQSEHGLKRSVKYISDIYLKVIKYISDLYLKVIGILILFMALLGLILFSLPAISKDNFESIYFFIGTAITLSGFTMLSGIFEKPETKPTKPTKPKIVKKLFRLSIIFLFSAFLFILFIGLYSGLKDRPTQIQFLNYITIGTYILGISLFFIGFTYLIYVLIQYYDQIDKVD